MIAQLHHARVQFVVIRHEHSALAGGEGFGSVKTKRRHVTERPRFASIKFAANGLGGILNNFQAMLIRNSPQRGVIRHATI